MTKLQFTARQIELMKKYNIEVDEIEVELKRKEHRRSVFGTVPLGETTLINRVIVDKVDALLNTEDKK